MNALSAFPALSHNLGRRDRFVFDVWPAHHLGGSGQLLVTMNGIYEETSSLASRSFSRTMLLREVPENEYVELRVTAADLSGA